MWYNREQVVQDLTGNQAKPPIEYLAQQIARRRLALPAILFLEVARPFSFMAGQGLLLCEPFFGFFYDEPHLAEYADLLADRSNVDYLIACLERIRSSQDNNDGEES
jgi:hypothetical protein